MTPTDVLKIIGGILLLSLLMGGACQLEMSQYEASQARYRRWYCPKHPDEFICFKEDK